jgi:hypothetical protein
VVGDSKITAQIGIGHCATWDPGKFVAIRFLACWLVKQMACIKWLYSLFERLDAEDPNAVLNIVISNGGCLYHLFSEMK